MRGVYGWGGLTGRLIGGSSPHARGLHEDTNLERSLVRIIPACAGFTNLFRLTSMAPPDHPRMRGVYRICSPDVGLSALDHPRMRGVYAPPAREATSRWGSSPHARGLRWVGQARRWGRGIIPACAGFTRRGPRRRAPEPDHPRMRGVYGPIIRRSEALPGSSPHARGLLCRMDAHTIGGRIIPACAGFTASRSCCSCCSWDHPRMRGVYAGGPVALEADAGIIPACAGFTRRRVRLRCRTADHPRMRGVYHENATTSSLDFGSSPHARGLRRGRRHDRRTAGIIPACAGFTRDHRGEGNTPPDHPRMRGVYAPTSQDGRTRRGSSPHARGLHLAILGIPTMPYPTRRLLLSLLT